MHERYCTRYVGLTSYLVVAYLCLVADESRTDTCFKKGVSLAPKCNGSGSNAIEKACSLSLKLFCTCKTLQFSTRLVANPAEMHPQPRPVTGSRAPYSDRYCRPTSLRQGKPAWRHTLTQARIVTPTLQSLHLFGIYKFSKIHLNLLCIYKDDICI